MDSSQKWQVVAGLELIWRVWGDEHIVYHSGTGDTHLLNPAAASVLRMLQKKTTTVTELVDALSTSDDVPGKVQGINLQLIIDHLEQLCLIEVVLP